MNKKQKHWIFIAIIALICVYLFNGCSIAQETSEEQQETSHNFAQVCEYYHDCNMIDEECINNVCIVVSFN